MWIYAQQRTLVKRQKTWFWAKLGFGVSLIKPVRSCFVVNTNLRDFALKS